MPKELKTRVTRKGYHQFFDKKEESWEYTHRRVVEKKLGRRLGSDEVVHHINGDKSNNRPENLSALKGNVHQRIHSGHPNACFRCGRSGHSAGDCYASTDFEGKPL